MDCARSSTESTTPFDLAHVLEEATASSQSPVAVFELIAGQLRLAYENRASRVLGVRISELGPRQRHAVEQILHDAAAEVMRSGLHNEVEIEVNDRVIRVETTLIGRSETDGVSGEAVTRRCKDITELRQADWTAELLDLARIVESDRAIDRALRIGSELLELPIAVFADIEDHVVVVRAVRGAEVVVDQLPLSAGFSQLISSGRIALVRDLDAYGFSGPLVEALGLQSLAAVPVIDGTAVRAMLCFGDTHGRETRFPANTRPLLEGLSVTLANRLRRDAAVAEMVPIEVLQRSNRELGEYAYAAAHDLRSPLRAIRGFSELLVEDATRDPVDLARIERLALRIEAGADRMERLLSSMLEHAFETTSTPHPTDLGQLVSDVVEGFDPLLQEVGATVEVEGLPTVAIDPPEAARVIQNLLENAIKYRHPDRSLRVVFVSAVEDGELVVRVIDNGRGIAEEDRARIFGLFRRASDLDDGFGVGLALVKRVMEDHGGSVDVHSAPGIGTTFELRLPADLVVDDGAEALSDANGNAPRAPHLTS